jgi:N-methylhydantoinase B
MRNRPDPFTIEVIRHALVSAAEEMSLVVARSARSPLLRETGDLSSALTDGEGRTIAQGRDMPVHLGVMNFTVKEFLKRVDRAVLRPGDMWVLNLPEVGGNHLPDVKVIRPIFHDGELAAFAVSLAHWVDIGGAMPGSYYAAASDIWQEGVRIPPTRLFADDKPVQDKIDLIMANVRGADEREGDLLAQAASTRAAEVRMREIFAEHGLATFRAAIEEQLDQSERQTRRLLRGLPQGTFHGEDELDNRGPNGERVRVRVDVTIREDSATFDFSRTDDAIEAPMNASPFLTAAAVCYMVKALAGEQIFNNDGVFRPLEIITRPGSLLQPGPYVPVVGGTTEVTQRCTDAIIKSLADAIPERLTAGGSATSGIMIFSGRRPDGQWWTYYESHAGGEGARAERDGHPVVRTNVGNIMNTPVETIETAFPIRVVRQQLRRGSGGAGRHRGGDGMIREYRMLSDHVEFTTMVERGEVAPYALAGGGAGTPFRVTLLHEGDPPKQVSGKGNYHLRRGDTVLVETAGGGGYGKA